MVAKRDVSIPRTYVIDYTEISWRGKRTKVPMVTVILSWKGQSLETGMLMDTGATTTFLLPWVEEALGLEAAHGDTVAHGAGGSLKVRPSRVNLQIAARDTHGRASTSHLLDPVLILDSDEALPFSVLGRRPFLEWYELTVREPKGEFVLREFA
jgi:predicted aspartyl protease